MDVYMLVPDERWIRNGAYGPLEGPIATEELPRFLPPGALVAIRPLPDTRWSTVMRTVHKGAGRVVNAPIVLWTDLLGGRRTMVFANRARTLPVAGVIDTDLRSVTVLRTAIADPWTWPDQVVWWTEARAGTLAPVAQLRLRQLAEFAAQYPTGRGFMAAHGPPERQWGRLFERAGIGTVGTWHAVLRCVAIALKLQQEPTAATADLAARLGYLDPKSLRERLRIVLGVGVPEIRAALGGQWLLAEGLKRKGVLRNGQICRR